MVCERGHVTMPLLGVFWRTVVGVHVTYADSENGEGAAHQLPHQRKDALVADDRVDLWPADEGVAVAGLVCIAADIAPQMRILCPVPVEARDEVGNLVICKDLAEGEVAIGAKELVVSLVHGAVSVSLSGMDKRIQKVRDHGEVVPANGQTGSQRGSHNDEAKLIRPR